VNAGISQLLIPLIKFRMVAVVRAAWQRQTKRHACSYQKDFHFSLSCWQRQIKTNAVKPRQWRNAALFGRLVAPLPAFDDFFDRQGAPTSIAAATTCILIEVLPLCGTLLVAAILGASLASGCNAVVTSRNARLLALKEVHCRGLCRKT
jgi:hypothetical protein